ncbi:MAG: hypothetical protein KIS72_03470 [Luteimonas sp.]|nr:hypothetical protein [Luteimonas sp.]
MEFRIPLDTTRVDIGALEGLLQSLDPAAIADFDILARTLRVSSSLDEAQIADCLSRIGHAVEAAAVERQPSVCCGGCGG